MLEFKDLLRFPDWTWGGSLTCSLLMPKPLCPIEAGSLQASQVAMSRSGALPLSVTYPRFSGILIQRLSTVPLNKHRALRPNGEWSPGYQQLWNLPFGACRLRGRCYTPRLIISFNLHLGGCKKGMKISSFEAGLDWQLYYLGKVRGIPHNQLVFLSNLTA